jgi:hypothetical protein
MTESRFCFDIEDLVWSFDAWSDGVGGPAEPSSIRWFNVDFSLEALERTPTVEPEMNVLCLLRVP